MAVSSWARFTTPVRERLDFIEKILTDHSSIIPLSFPSKDHTSKNSKNLNKYIKLRCNFMGMYIVSSPHCQEFFWTHDINFIEGFVSVEPFEIHIFFLFKYGKMIYYIYYIESAWMKTAIFPNFCVPDKRDLSTGSHFNPRDTSMYSSG